MAILASIVFASWVLLLGDLLNNTMIGGHVRGGTADWFLVREAWMMGGEPYSSIASLAEKHLGWTPISQATPHPRPPSALFLLGLLGLIPATAPIWVWAAASALGLTIWVQCSTRWVGMSSLAELAVIPMALMPPILQGVIWGTQMMVVAAAIGFTLLNWQAPRRRSSGIALASALKLFPFLLAFAAKRGRGKTVLWTAGTLLLLSIGGLMLPGVDAADAFAAMSSAPDSYGAGRFNLSINGVLAWPAASWLLPLGGLGLVLLLSRLIPERSTIAVTLVVMVLLSPLAWPEYTVLWLPSLLLLWGDGRMLGKVAFVGLVGLVALARLEGSVLMFAGLALVGLIIWMTPRASPPAPCA
jgi:hypothetical protein